MKILSFTALAALALVSLSCGNHSNNQNNTEPEPEAKYIALSFDDGPNLVTTPKVLDVLEEYGVKASFFVIGQHINDESAEMMKRAHNMGCDIENHSFTHGFMSSMSEEQLVDEISRTSALVEKYVGEAPKFFRPPYINHNDLMHQTIDLVFICGQGCEDWVAEVSAEERAKRVIEAAEDGQIVLVHDFEGNDNTVEALKTIIPELQAQGYKFVTVPEIFAAKGIDPVTKDGKIYTNVLKD